MKRSLLAILSLLLFLAASGISARETGETKTLQAEKNNTLIESSDGSLSNAKGPGLFVGRTGQPAGSIRRGLIAFDIAGSIPARAKITSVKLTMNLTLSAGEGQSEVTLHRVLQDWGEGSSRSMGGRGDSATDGDATWLHTFYPDRKWRHPGGDFLASPSASQSVGNAGPYIWTGPQMVSDVQSWLNSPKQNFGWAIVGDEMKPATAKVFASRHNPDASATPRLTVTFLPPAR